MPLDISLGGMRIYSDEEAEIGAMLVLELFLPNGPVLTCKGQVAWVERLPAGAPALFDVGIHFTDFTEGDHARLAAVLAAEA